MVGVGRGVWVKGNPDYVIHGPVDIPVPRISTLTWTGGMIELRAKGRGPGKGCGAIHVDRVWTVLVTGAQLLGDTITENLEPTYGVVAENSRGIVVTGCDINAVTHGVATYGACSGVSVGPNTFTNCPNRIVLSPETVGRSTQGNVET